MKEFISVFSHPSCDAVSWQPLESHAVVLRKLSTVVEGAGLAAKVGEGEGGSERQRSGAAESCLVLLRRVLCPEWYL